MLYICTKFCQSISYGFRDVDLNISVGARVVAYVDGRIYRQMYVRTYGKPDPYIAPCLRPARQKELPMSNFCRGDNHACVIQLLVIFQNNPKNPDLPCNMGLAISGIALERKSYLMTK